MEFQQTLSQHLSEDRPLRILHIGNIANNAYLNAKMLNQAGYDCDVICYDYYHIMGCPEWEDADFTGPPVDEFKPNWDSVDLRGFQRPRWFAQGPVTACLSYLYARRTGQSLKAVYWWHYLVWYRRLHSNPRWAWLLPVLHFGHKIYLKARGLRRRSVSFWQRGANFSKRAVHFLLRLPFRVLRRGWRELRQSFGYLPTQLPQPQPSTRLVSPLPTPPAPDPTMARIERLVHCFAETFPDRPDLFKFADTDHYRGHLPLWQQLFAHYDVIHAYASDPAWPLLAGKRPYVAFEHATIRHIPFEDNFVGRLTALGYNQADWVIITNCDNNVAAERLKIPRYRFVPHPINEGWARQGLGDELRRQLLAELNADFIAFHPPRQHWEPHRDQSWRDKGIDPSWLKGNDIFIEGLAQFIHQVAPRAAAVMVEWGQKVAESKALLAQLGIANRVKWIPPQHSCEMLRTIDACDLLVDQFWVGAFGSTMPKALLIGKPAMSYVEPEMHRWCLPEMPPVISPRTPEEVFEGLKRAYQDPAWLQDIARQGSRWYHKYHSNKVICNALGEIYHDALKHPRPNT